MCDSFALEGLQEGAYVLFSVDMRKNEKIRILNKSTTKALNL